MKRLLVLILALLPIAASAQKSNFAIDVNGGLFVTDNAIGGGGVSLIWQAPVSDFYLGAGVGMSYRMGSENNNGTKTMNAHQALIPVFAHAAYNLSEKFMAALDAGCAAGLNVFAEGGPAYLFIPYAEPQIFYDIWNGFKFGIGYQCAYDKVRKREVIRTEEYVMGKVSTVNLLSQALTFHISMTF